jgi:hypothetical protein
MYWMLIRWGGSLAVIIIVGAMLILANDASNKPSNSNGGEQGLRIN